MKRIGWAFALALLIGLPSTGLAAPLTYTATFDLGLIAGPDSAGLAGATLTFSVVFASGTTYGPVGPFPVTAVSASHTLTITGSAGGLSDGVYSDPGGVIWDPGGPTFFNPAFFFPMFGPLAAGQTLDYGIFLSAAPMPVAGAGVTIADFGAMFAFSVLTTMPDMTMYSIAPAPPPMSGATGGPTPVELMSFEIE